MDLKQLRINAGYSQSQLALICGINLRSLQDYEQGHKLIENAKGETLYRLSLALGCSIDDMLRDRLSHIEGELNPDHKAMTLNRLLAYEKALDARKKQIVHFPIIETDSEVDMSRIYPTKQSFVSRVLKVLRGDERVTSLRLFGSSITMACNQSSDIDFAVGIRDFSNETRNDISEKIQLACDWGADILWMDHLSIDDRVYQDIMRGLVLI